MDINRSSNSNEKKKNCKVFFFFIKRRHFTSFELHVAVTEASSELSTTANLFDFRYIKESKLPE
jgi:hypothetical protein